MLSLQSVRKIPSVSIILKYLLSGFYLKKRIEPLLLNAMQLLTTISFSDVAPPKVSSAESTLAKHMAAIKHFNAKRVEEILTKTNRSTCDDVFLRRVSLIPIMKVRCTKLKGEKIHTLHLTKKGDRGEYPKRIWISKLVKYGYSKWLEIQGIVKNHKN